MNLLTLIFAFFTAAAVSLAASPLENSRPNIVLVITDDQGLGDLACMGNEVLKTPHLDDFHARSVRLTDFHVSPTCAPTRAAIMSGVAPFNAGISHTIMLRERLAPSIFTLPQALKSADYNTGLFGKWHLGDEVAYLPQNRGFDEVLMHGAGGIGQSKYGDFHVNSGENCYFDNVLLHNDTIVKTKGYCTDLFFDAALSWMNQKRKEENPYFAYIALNAPHGPFIAPEANAKRFTDLGYDQMTAGRYGMIENIDTNFGKLIAQLDSWGELENTLVLFMTDNGGTGLRGKLNGKPVTHFNFNMRGGKNTPNEGGTHVPSFWYWKGKVEGGIDIPALTAELDFYPTFTQLSGATLPEKMQSLEGRSLLPLFDDPSSVWPDRELFFHCGRWAAGERDSSKHEKCAIRTARWRLVDHKNLYDILADPGETTDVADQHPEVVNDLRKAYDAWWDSTEPFLVNEGYETVKPDDQPLEVRYRKQLAEKGIPDWEPISGSEP